MITAFEPYDRWKTNASWLALVELARELPERPRIVTRRYPVDFVLLRERLEADLQANYDYALHLGQSGTVRRACGWKRWESILAREREQSPQPLVADGPVAYQSTLPLDEWSTKLNAAGIPATVSYHAGTFLCNATLYLSCYLAERMSLPTQSAFIHLPLDVTQTVGSDQRIFRRCRPLLASGTGLRLILAELAGRRSDRLPRRCGLGIYKRHPRSSEGLSSSSLTCLPRSLRVARRRRVASELVSAAGRYETRRVHPRCTESLSAGVTR